MRSERGRPGMSYPVDPKDLRRWCAIPAAELLGHPDLRVRFRQVADSTELGRLMAGELVEVIEGKQQTGTSHKRHYSLRTYLLV